MRSLEQSTQTVRRSGGILSDFPRSVLSVQGKDRAQFLHRLLSHDIRGLPPGQARPACLLDRQGKIVFSALVHALEQEILLEMVPEELEKALRSLERYVVSEQVEFRDLTDRYRIIAVHGPAVPHLLEKLSAQAPAGIHRTIRWDWLRLPGFHLWTAPDKAGELQKSLSETGSRLEISEISREVFDVLRIEAGTPWPGHEIIEGVILNELGSEEFVSFTKGCFIGQEIVARIKYRAHPPRLLTGFRLNGVNPAPPGSAIRMLDAGQEVGVITSSCFSPALNCPIALGFLQHGRTETEFQVTAAGDHRATVTALPFI